MSLCSWITLLRYDIPTLIEAWWEQHADRPLHLADRCRVRVGG
jgi:hypothetical protein